MSRQTALPNDIALAPKLHGQRLRAALTDDAAYVVGLAQLVAEPRVVQVTPCVDSGNVLFTREVYENALAPGAAAEVATEIQVLLYSARRRRCSMVFRYSTQTGERLRIGKVLWWVGGEQASFALHRTSPDGKEKQTMPLLLQVPTEKVYPLKIDVPLNLFTFHLTSPTKPFALFVVDKSAKQPGRVYRVHADGSVQLLRNDDAVGKFLPDGESYLLGREMEGGEIRHSVFNVLTGKEQPLSAAEAERLEPLGIEQAERDESLPSKLPLQLVQRLSTGEPSVPLLFLAPQHTKGGEETLLLGDAEPAGISQDLKAVFYYQQGQLYLLPLQKLPLGIFLQGRERELRELTLRRARSLATYALPYYLENHEQKWPLAGTPLEDIFKGLTRDIQLTQNPLTGRDDLRFEYDGSSAPHGKETRVASLGGPGGRAVIFGDGQVVWEPNRRP